MKERMVPSTQRVNILKQMSFSDKGRHPQNTAVPNLEYSPGGKEGGGDLPYLTWRGLSSQLLGVEIAVWVTLRVSWEENPRRYRLT